MAGSGTQPLRLVLDTNIVVAGLLWSGPPRRLLQAAIAEEVELHSSAVLLDELAQTLGYAKFAGRIEAFGTRIATGDADDDHFIAAAVAARAELIVTGDRKHLLPIGSHQGIAIVTAREVVERLGERSNP